MLLYHTFQYPEENMCKYTFCECIPCPKSLCFKNVYPLLMSKRFVGLWLYAAAVVSCSNLNNKANLIESQTHTIINNNLLNGLVKMQRRYFDGTELHTQVNLLTNNFLNDSYKWEINWFSVLFTASFMRIKEIQKRRVKAW